MSLSSRIVRPTIRAVSARGVSNAAVRQKHTLPDLQYDYAELEPSISGKIMEVRSSVFGFDLREWLRYGTVLMEVGM